MKKKLISLFLVVVLLCACACPTYAAGPTLGGETARLAVGQTNIYSEGVFAEVVANGYSHYYAPITSTQTQHIKGVETSISLTRSETKSLTASGSLGCDVSLGLGVGIEELINVSLEGTLSAQISVAYTQSYTNQTTITYTIPSTYETCLVRMVFVFPRKTVIKKVIGVNHQGEETLIWSEKVTYAPKTSDQYVSWQTYNFGE